MIWWIIVAMEKDGYGSIPSREKFGKELVNENGNVKKISTKQSTPNEILSKISNTYEMYPTPPCPSC